MKKVGVLILILVAFLLALSIVSAQNSTEEKGYSCLKSKLGSNCGGTDNVEQLSFSLLAMAYDSSQSNCKSALLNKKTNENWNNNIKQTSLAILALNNIGQDTNKQETWLLSKTKTPTELEWYLEIEASQASSCDITYDSSARTINIGDNKKISSDAGSCLTRAYENYWLKVSDSCLNKNFTVSCNKDFISTLLYKKANSNTWYVSSDVKSASAGAKTENRVDSSCFGTSACDYEGSLWAVLALQKTDNNITKFLPYLIALAEDNEKYFPSSLLYYLANSDNDLQQILNSQKTQGYWDFSVNKFYDTALALLALSESQAETKAKEWLAQEQASNGCWNSGNIKDTAFLLWAGWPKTPIQTGVEEADCEKYNHYCTTNAECLDAGGNKLDNYLCPSPKVCCDKQAIETCSEKGGKVCSTGETCDISEITASDTSKCCTGSCVSETSECEQQDYSCRASCLTGEETASYDCSGTDVCCKPTTTPSGIAWWIWVLIILIILVVLGIIFRNRLRVFLFKSRGGVKSSGVTMTRPPFIPPSAMPTGLRRMIPPMSRAPIRQVRPATRTDKELEETLRKLKEMSK